MLKIKILHLLRCKSEKGQGLLEFLIFMPVVMTILWYLVEVNMAINMSLVNQKHARTWIFQKLFNHPWGPADIGGDHNIKRSAFMYGISRDDVVGGSSSPAPSITLGLGVNPKSIPGVNDTSGEVAFGELRQKIRVRTSFGICTHRKLVDDGQQIYTDFCADSAGAQ